MCPVDLFSDTLLIAEKIHSDGVFEPSQYKMPAVFSKSLKSNDSYASSMKKSFENQTH
jgi:hypothetical protein